MKKHTFFPTLSWIFVVQFQVTFGITAVKFLEGYSKKHTLKGFFSNLIWILGGFIQNCRRVFFERKSSEEKLWERKFPPGGHLRVPSLNRLKSCSIRSFRWCRAWRVCGPPVFFTLQSFPPQDPLVQSAPLAFLLCLQQLQCRRGGRWNRRWNKGCRRHRRATT